MKPAMTGQQAEALAAFIVTLRPGQSRWTKATVFDALTAAASAFTPDAETLTRAAVRAALTGSIIAPEVIAMTGAHWESVNHAPAHEPHRAARCESCHDRHMPDAPCTEPATVSAAEHIARARAALKQTKRYDPPDTQPVTDVQLPDTEAR